MQRLILIDAYNAMFRLWSEVPEDRDVARRRLLARARQALAHNGYGGRGDRIHLVFDTRPGADRAGLHSRDGQVSWHYADGSADEQILAHLRRHEGRRRGPGILVVTDDRELAGRARQLGARSIPVRTFFAPGLPARPGTERRRGALGPPFRASDFGLPDGEIDLLGAREDGPA